jgi:RNA polymerase sigma-70 factor (ECF subfamily)
MRAEIVRDELARSQERFLRYLRTKLGTDAAAEDVLHSAYVKAVESAETLQSADSLVPWFRRILANEVADHFRRAARESRAVTAAEREREAEPTAEPERNICRCVSAVLTTIKPEYAAAVAAVDVEGTSVEQLAQSSGITSNNASVRLHRARASLRKRLVAVCGSCAGAGCFDCSCSPSSSSP